MKSSCHLRERSTSSLTPPCYYSQSKDRWLRSSFLCQNGFCTDVVAVLTLRPRLRAIGINASEKKACPSGRVVYAVPHCMRGSTYASCTSGERALGQTRLVLCPGLERDHQSFTRLDQRRCCCSQLPQSFKAFCHLHPQSPGISLFPIAYPCHKDTRESNLISALTQQNETLHFCHEVILSLLSSAAASSRAKKHNSNGNTHPRRPHSCQASSEGRVAPI